MLRAISRKAYNTLRCNKLTLKPLPAIDTINRRIRHFTCPPGIQHDLFSLLKLKLSTGDTWEQETVLMFDEVQFKDSCDFSERLKRLFIHEKKAQVVLLRYMYFIKQILNTVSNSAIANTIYHFEVFSLLKGPKPIIFCGIRS